MYRNRDQEVNQSKTLLCTVLLFLVLNLPRLVLFHMELRRIQGFSLCKVTQDHTSEFLLESRIRDPVFSIPDPGLFPLQGNAGSCFTISSRIQDPGSGFFHPESRASSSAR
jgi:hypothetical protein